MTMTGQETEHTAEPGDEAEQAAAKADFYHLVEDFLNWLLDEEPTYATSLGVHAYDNRLADMSWARIEAGTRRTEQFARRLAGFTPGADTAWAIDLALMQALLGRQVRGVRDLDLPHRSPDLYLGEALFGPYTLLTRDFAPL